MRWDIFCTVVDNFGDIGVCWRLARQLAKEYRFSVRLWVDDLITFRKICPALDPLRDVQTVSDVQVLRWHAVFPEIVPADVVIEAFACTLPDTYVSAMAQVQPKVQWINLEYLSAESWVLDCHALPSPHPCLPLTKWFFFPSVLPGSGGLLRESDVTARRQAFLSNLAAQTDLWASLGVPPVVANECRILLFCYDNPAVESLLTAWSSGAESVTCLLPNSPVMPRVAAWLGEPSLSATQCVVRGSLTVRVIPFLEQSRFDELCWACDVNFVRGEDSFVRALWAERPFVWQIYPQDDDVHLVKLEAFLAQYAVGLSSEAESIVRQLWQGWNTGNDIGLAWEAFAAVRPELAEHAHAWAEKLQEIGDLAGNLVKFCAAQGVQ